MLPEAVTLSRQRLATGWFINYLSAYLSSYCRNKLKKPFPALLLLLLLPLDPPWSLINSFKVYYYVSSSTSATTSTASTIHHQLPILLYLSIRDYFVVTSRIDIRGVYKSNNKNKNLLQHSDHHPNTTITTNRPSIQPLL